VLVYGGAEHRYWLQPHLPKGIMTTLLPSWTARRDAQRKQEKRSEIHRYQRELFHEKYQEEGARA
jgi:hypothetical protein